MMRGLNSATFDLIYLDPPFNSNHDYAAPIGSKAAGAAFKDTWCLDEVNLAWHGEIKHDFPGVYSLMTATREIHGDSMMSYLIYMAVRIIELRRLLKPAGTVYLHCDWNASHYLKVLMDSIFGKASFRNEIVWCYAGGGAPKRDFPRKHDVLLRYSPSDGRCFNADAVRVPYASEYKATVFTDKASRAPGRVYTRHPDGKIVEDWWTGISRPYGDERCDYPTQKPLELLDRVILASSNQGDLILDPFCGCATTCISANMLGRRWVGIDIAPRAADLVRDRMLKECRMMFDGVERDDVPSRTDLGEVIPYNDLRNKQRLYGEQGGYCNGCEDHFAPRHFHVDHIIPRAKGGTDHISNLQLLCGHCNSVKGDRPQEYLLACLTDKGWIKRKMAA
ncbi:MAG: hypothetical protein F4029_16225 [Gammaproteobacteria bacterium]|nr:hypothetical protein [Gammaproteobacteria bacterium]